MEVEPLAGGWLLVRPECRQTGGQPGRDQTAEHLPPRRLYTGHAVLLVMIDSRPPPCGRTCHWFAKPRTVSLQAFANQQRPPLDQCGPKVLRGHRFGDDRLARDRVGSPGFAN